MAGVACICTLRNMLCTAGSGACPHPERMAGAPTHYARPCSQGDGCSLLRNAGGGGQAVPGPGRVDAAQHPVHRRQRLLLLRPHHQAVRGRDLGREAHAAAVQLGRCACHIAKPLLRPDMPLHCPVLGFPRCERASLVRIASLCECMRPCRLWSPGRERVMKVHAVLLPAGSLYAPGAPCAAWCLSLQAATCIADGPLP